MDQLFLITEEFDIAWYLIAIGQIIMKVEILGGQTPILLMRQQSCVLFVSLVMPNVEVVFKVDSDLIGSCSPSGSTGQIELIA